MTKARIILENLISTHGDTDVHGIALFPKGKGVANIIVSVHPKKNAPNAMFVFDYIRKLGAKSIIAKLA